MKKLTVLIVMSLMLSCLFAQHYIGFGNDTFSYGFSDDRDDGIAHSIILGYEGDLDKRTSYDVNVHLMAYTVRPRTYTNVKGEMDYLEGRIDELRVTGGLSSDILINDSKLTSRFQVGYSFYGNFGGEFLQNLCHDTLGLKPVNLGYSALDAHATLLCMMTFETDGRLRLGISTWGGYEGLMKMGGKVFTKYGEDKAVFDAFFGAEVNLNLDDKILSVASMMTTGVMSGFSLDTGFLLLDYKRYHDMNNAYGTIAFAIGDDKVWEENDVFISYGVYPIYGKPMNTMVARKPIGDNIQIVFKDDFISEVYQNSPVQGMTTLSSIELGFRGGDEWFIQTSIGYGWTMCEDHAVNYYVENPMAQKEGYTTSSLELGYSWMSPITVGSSNLGVELFCGMHMKGDTNLLRNHTEYANLNVTDVAPYFGARAVMGIDF